LKITIGIPAFNEEKNIAKIITSLKKITDSIIVCDDGSSDMTSEIAKNLNVIVVKHEKNMGYGAAINTIFQRAKDIGTEILVTFDADGQHRIEDISKVINPIEENIADVVIGSRFLKENSQVPNYRKIGIKAITKVTNASIINHKVRIYYEDSQNTTYKNTPSTTGTNKSYLLTQNYQ